jgi:hypothetical protein
MPSPGQLVAGNGEEVYVPNLVPPQLVTGFLLWGSSGARFVHAPARSPLDARQSQRRPATTAGPGRRTPTASGNAPGGDAGANSSSGGSSSSWLRGGSGAPDLGVFWRTGCGASASVPESAREAAWCV